MAEQTVASPEIPGLLTSFDNTPRRAADKAVLWNMDKPDVVLTRFRESLYAAVYFETCCRPKSALPNAVPPDRRFVIVNAWNEWAEGMAMEPSTTYKTGFLEAVLEVKRELRSKGC